jgi:hypothetical protein
MLRLRLVRNSMVPQMLVSVLGSGQAIDVTHAVVVPALEGSLASGDEWDTVLVSA